MKSFKIPILIVVVATAMTTYAASASADYVTRTTGGPGETPSIHFVNEGGHLRFETDVSDILCSSTAEGTVASHGAGSAVGIPLGSLSFTGCTNSWHVTVQSSGSLEIEATTKHSGVVYSNGMVIQATRFGLTCVYETYGGPIGTITGGNPATINIDGGLNNNTAKSGVLSYLGDTPWWEGNYVTTSALYVVDS